ncbi:hypothetical protein NKJ06_21160 [Mesorhizobium sp. M0293]|uniref:hypothetical protein n=1 Tax=Mesorhizobium sp. M0293 TaxID=2956930 RepID=UPI00333AA4C1
MSRVDFGDLPTTAKVHLDDQQLAMAAARVRVARTLAAAFPSEETARELAAAMAAFQELRAQVRVK